jgi:hypothetical protein
VKVVTLVVKVEQPATMNVTAVTFKQGDKMRLRKSRKKLPNPFFVKITTKFLLWNYQKPIICATPVIFTKTTHSKQSPNRRKFAQSGHPAFKHTVTIGPQLFQNKFLQES